jgi:hypothetical protein
MFIVVWDNVGCLKVEEESGYRRCVKSAGKLLHGLCFSELKNRGQGLQQLVSFILIYLCLL